MYFNDSKAFIEFSNDMDDTYKNFEEYSPNKKRNLIVTELFIRWRKLKYFSCFYYTSYFAVLKCIRLNSTHYFVMTIPNNFNNFRLIILQISKFKILWIFIKTYSCLVIDTTILSNNNLRFRKNLVERI